MSSPNLQNILLAPVPVKDFPVGHPFSLLNEPFHIVYWRLAGLERNPLPDQTLVFVRVLDEDARAPTMVPMWLDSETLVKPAYPESDQREQFVVSSF